MRSEIETLKNEVLSLSHKLSKVKAEYASNDLTEDETEDLVNDYSATYSEISKFISEIYQKEFCARDEKLTEKYPKWKRFPITTRNSIITADLFLDSIVDDMDYSAAILGYSKAIEKILDEKITLKHLDDIKKSIENKEISIREPSYIKSILPLGYSFQNRNGSTKSVGLHRSISLGAWNFIIQDALNGENRATCDATFKKILISYGRGDLEKLRLNLSNIFSIRNGCLHTNVISREKVLQHIPVFESTIGLLLSMLY